MSGGMTVQDTGQIRCLCTFTDEDGGSSIYCESCGFWQHASCIGVANEELPELWFCWLCRPENFQFVDGSGSTLAASLGISHSPSHWNPAYEASEGSLVGSLGLEINPLASSSRSSHSLRISNLLSPAPTAVTSSNHPPAQQKIVLDPGKAKKRQETRRLDEERIKKLQQSHHSRRVSVVTTDGPPTAVKPKSRKTILDGKKTTGVAAVPVQDPSASMSVVPPSTPGATVTSVVGTPIASTSSANLHSRRKSSANASSRKKPQLPLSPHPSSTTPRATYSAFPAQSPRVQLPHSQRTPTRSPSPISATQVAQTPLTSNLDRPTPNDTVPSHPDTDEIQTPIDYFSSLSKGKGKETEFIATTPVNDYSNRNPLSAAFTLQTSATYTPSFPPFPLQPSHHPPFISNSQLSHNLGGGAHVNIPKGAPTGSAISRPKALSIRSFRFDTSSSDAASSSFPPSRPFSLFLDPVPPQPPPPVPPFQGPLSVFTPLTAGNPASPLADSNSSLGSPPRSSRRTPARPNAVLRPLICDGTASPFAQKGPDDDGYAFAVFALKDLKLGEPVVLGWEVEAPQNDTRVVNSNLDYIAETFVTCGCGKRSKDCAEGVHNKRMAERARTLDERRLSETTASPGKRGRSAELDMRLLTEKVIKKPRREPPPNRTLPLPPRGNPGLGIRLPSPSTAAGFSSTSSSPIPSTPKARLRARYEARKELTLTQLHSGPPSSNIAAPNGLVSKPFLPRIVTTMSPTAPPQSLESSPLTEQSASEGDDDVEVDRGNDRIRNMSLSVNGSSKNRRDRRMRPTPLADQPGSRGTSIPQDKIPTLPAAHLPLDQRGPPRFRKWVAKRSPLPSTASLVTEEPSVQLGVSTPEPPPQDTARDPTPHLDADGDTAMESNEDGGQGSSGKFRDSSSMPPPPVPASQDPTTIRSIGHLLNPAPPPASPALPSTALPSNASVTPVSPVIPITQDNLSSPMPPSNTPLPQDPEFLEKELTDTTQSLSISSPPSSSLFQQLQASFVRTSSPTLNHLLNVPKTVAEELSMRPSPLGAKPHNGGSHGHDVDESQVEEEQALPLKEPTPELEDPDTQTTIQQSAPMAETQADEMIIDDTSQEIPTQDIQEDVVLRSPEATVHVEQVSESPPAHNGPDEHGSPKVEAGHDDLSHDVGQSSLVEAEMRDDAVNSQVGGESRSSMTDADSASHPASDEMAHTSDSVQLEDSSDPPMAEVPPMVAQQTMEPEANENCIPSTPEKVHPPLVHVILASPSSGRPALAADLPEPTQSPVPLLQSQPLVAEASPAEDPPTVPSPQSPSPIQQQSSLDSPTHQGPVFVQPRTPSPPPPASPKPTIRKMSFADYARRRKEAKEKMKSGSEGFLPNEVSPGRTVEKDIELYSKVNGTSEALGAGSSSEVLSAVVLSPALPAIRLSTPPLQSVIHVEPLTKIEDLQPPVSDLNTLEPTHDADSKAAPNSLVENSMDCGEPASVEGSGHQPLANDENGLKSEISETSPECNGAIDPEASVEGTNQSLEMSTNQNDVAALETAQSNIGTSLGTETLGSSHLASRFVDQDVLGSPLSTLGLDALPSPKIDLRPGLVNPTAVVAEVNGHVTDERHTTSPTANDFSPKSSPPSTQPSLSQHSPIVAPSIADQGHNYVKDEEVNERLPRKPPTEPRSSRLNSQCPTALALVPAANMGVAEEGEITSSPTSPIQHRQSNSMSPRHGRDRNISTGPSSIPTQPRSYTPSMPSTPRALSPFRRGHSRPPPTQPRGSLPSGPRALRELGAISGSSIPTMPRGGMRLGSGPTWDDDRDRDRDWERERDRHRDDRDPRDRRERERDPRDVRWSRGRGWRGRR